MRTDHAEDLGRYPNSDVELACEVSRVDEYIVDLFLVFSSLEIGKL